MGNLILKEQSVSGFTAAPLNKIKIAYGNDDNLYRIDDANNAVVIGGGGGSQTLAQTLALGNTSGAYDILINTGQKIGFKDGDNTYTTYISNNQSQAGNRTVYLPLFDGQLTYHGTGTPLTTNYVLKGTTNGAITSSSLIFDNGTNVGINQPSPSANLHIISSSGTTFRVDGSTYNNIFSIHDSKSVQIGRAYNAGYGNTHLLDVISPDAFSVTQRFTYGYNNGSTIDSNAYIGIDPANIAASSYKNPLNVSALSIFGNASSSGFLNVNSYDATKYLTFVWEPAISGSNYNFTLRDHNSSRLFTFGANGNFGIGYGGNSNIVDEKLVAAGNIRLHQSTPATVSTQTIDGNYIKLNSNYWDGSQSVNRSFFIKTFQTSTTPTERFGILNNGNTELFSIASTGNVGIGETSPTARLHAKGSTSDDTAYALKLDNISNSALLYVRNDRFVGIGISAPTTANGLFQVSQNSYNEVARFQGYFGGTFDAVVISKDGNLIAEQYAQFKQTVSLGGTIATTAKLLSAPNDWSIEFGNTTINNDSVNSKVVYKSGYNKFSFRNSSNFEGVFYDFTSDIPKVGIGQGTGTTTATLHVKGATSNSTAYALKVDNSTPSPLLYVGNDGNVGIGTTSNDASAKLQIDSTTQGVLLPRMTSTQASAITAVNGLILYVTDTNLTFTSVGFWGYENGSWVKL